MAITATRSINVVYSGDVVANNTFSAGSNGASPGQIQKVRLAIGANTITVPGAGTTPVSVTIIPPTGNVNLLTLKGIAGDTGVALHKTDPTSVGLDSTVATFVINAAAQTDVTLVWT